MAQHDYRQALINKIGIPVEKGEVMLGSVRTTYLAAGSGPAVVCVHGAGAGAVTWYQTIGALAEHFHVIVPDVVGYGNSDKPKAAYDRPYFAAWLRDFLAAQGIKKAHVVGNSQGGTIGMQLAIKNPELIEKLVLVSPGGLGEKLTMGVFFGLFWLNIFPSAAAGRWMSRYLFYKPENSDPDYAAYNVQVVKKPGGSNVFMQGKGAAVSEMPEDELRKIQHQTLIIWGKEDNFLPIALGENAVKILPNAELHSIEKAGHLPFLEQPELFNEILLRFLKE